MSKLENMKRSENMNKSENKVCELTDKELDTVAGGAKQKPDGSGVKNVAAKWNLTQGAST